MQLAKKYIGAGLAALVIAAATIQSTGSVQAEKFGYVQSDCPTIVQQAVDTTGKFCTKAERNKLCYGNNSLSVQYIAGASGATFQQPGDLVDVSQIKQLTLGAMDTASGEWGLAEMKIKADLPDTDPTKAVTVILFGSVQLSGAEADANATAVVQTATAVPIHQTQAVIGTATQLAGVINTATANVSTPTPTGTIPAFRATSAAATATRLANVIHSATLTAVPPTLVSSGGPFQGLQAFYFQSSDTAPCDQAPHDGILIQSPHGGQRVTLSIDGATVSLGSTVYATAQPSKFLTLYTLEGSARVTVAGQSQTAGAGSAVQVPLDANLRASGTPQLILFYTADAVRALPVRILPIQITPVQGLSANASVSQWQVVYEFDRNTCVPDISYCHEYHRGQPTTYVITLAIDPNTIWWNGSGIVGVFASTGSNTYKFPFENGAITVHMLSPTHGEGTDVYTNLSYKFTETIPFHIDRLDSLTATP